MANVTNTKLSPPDTKQQRNKQRIIAAALELLDDQGLTELSLRKLAAKVGLKAPALYWYFKNKEELIDFMAEAILLKEFTDLRARTADESWQSWLITVCKRLRRAMLSHRDGARIVAGAHLIPAVTLARILEVASESLTSASLSEEDADTIIGTAIHFTFGRVIEEQSSPSLEELKTLDVAELADTLPRMARMVKNIQVTNVVYGFSDDGFEKSVRLIVR